MALIDEFVSLTEWLDDSVALPHVQSTLPNREQYLEAFRKRFKPQQG